MHELVDGIYAAVTEPDRWPIVLESISDAHRGASILLGRQNLDSGAQSLMSCRMAQGSVERYASDFSRPERLEFIRHLPDVALATPITPETFQGEEAFLRSPLYAQVFQPFGMRYLVTSILYREPGWACFFALARPAEAGPYEAEELERIGWLSQHLSRAMALQNAMSGAGASLDLLSEVADRFDRGALVADQVGQVRYANRAARELIGRGDGIVLSNGAVHCVRPAETARLLSLIAHAAATSAGDGLEPGGALRVTRSHEGSHYAVIVSPLMAAEGGGARDSLALVLITDPERPVPDVCRFAGLYDLTPAEARLAVRLLAGDTPGEAARELGVSITTIRFHLRNLLAKTGARRQAELINLLRQIPSD